MAQEIRTPQFGSRNGCIAAAVAYLVLAGTYAALADPSRRSRAALAYGALCVPSAYLIRAAWTRSDPRTLFCLVMLGLAARVPLTAAAPLWSNDAYRYVWDGRVALMGLDPRALAPDASALAAERAGPLWAHIDLRDIPTVYPPASLLLFRLAALLDPAGVRGAKAVALAGDLLACAALVLALRRLGLPSGRAASYALHPLVLISFAQDAHIEAYAVAGIVAGFSATRTARIGGLAVAILTKAYPVIVAPLMFARDRTGAIVLALLLFGATLPAFLSGHAFGSLHAYIDNQHFNDALFAVLGPIGGALLIAAVAIAAARAVQRGAPAPGASLAVLGTYLLATPNALPWYLTVLAPVIATMRRPFSGPTGPLVAAFALWTATVVLSYAAPWYVHGGSFGDIVIRVVEYAPLLFGALWWMRNR